MQKLYFSLLFHYSIMCCVHVYREQLLKQFYVYCVRVRVSSLLHYVNLWTDVTMPFI